MSSPKPPLRAKPVLTVDATVYERVNELLPGPHGERVLLARRLAPGQPPVHVLLKELAIPPADSVSVAIERACRRLEEEVRLGRYLQHPGIARVHALHPRPDSLIVELEYVPGTSLDEAISLALARQRHYPEPFVLYVGLRMAAVLAYAHVLVDEQGRPLNIVHRDLQPERIRITPGGEVKLGDFGVACSLLPGRLPTSVTRPHGQALYAAPEVLFGEKVDARADLFSLGLVLLELGTGFHLYDLPHLKESELSARLTDSATRRVARAGMAAMEADLPFDQYERAALHAAVFEPKDVEFLSARLTPPLRAVLLRLLCRDRDARYPSAEALEADLRKLADAAGPYGAGDAAAELERVRHEAGARVVDELT
jgi:serine/threonine-protein kinase